MRLEVYAWEENKFPIEQCISILPQFRAPLARAFARHMGIMETVDVRLVTGGGGRAYPNQWVKVLKLPRIGKDCRLGLIIHEVAHLYNYKRFGGKHHQGTWKKALIHCYVEYQANANNIEKEALEIVKARENMALMQAHKIIKEAERKREAKEYRKTSEYKMVILKRREKRLQTKIKRLNTILKTVQRKIRYQERSAVKRNQSVQVMEVVS